MRTRSRKSLGRRVPDRGYEPAWGPSVLADDTSTSGVDSDPSLHVEGNQIRVRDDAEGANGAFEIEITID